MNYIKELNSFYDWLETNTLSDSAIVLWHALMHTNNRAGWITEFAVAISVLEAKTGLKKSAIIRARHRLQQIGRIDFKTRSGNQATIYTMKSFEYQKETQTDTQNNIVFLRDANRHTNRTQTGTQSGTQADTITKLNETKEKETTGSLPNPFQVFEREGFGTISSYIADELNDMSQTYGDNWLCEAMKVSVLQGKRKLSYVHGILKRWKADGIDEPWAKDKPKEPEDTPTGYVGDDEAQEIMKRLGMI